MDLNVVSALGQADCISIYREQIGNQQKLGLGDGEGAVGARTFWKLIQSDLCQGVDPPMYLTLGLCMKLSKNERERQCAVSRHETGFPIEGTETSVKH